MKKNIKEFFIFKLALTQVRFRKRKLSSNVSVSDQGQKCNPLQDMLTICKKLTLNKNVECLAASFYLQRMLNSSGQLIPLLICPTLYFVFFWRVIRLTIVLYLHLIIYRQPVSVKLIIRRTCSRISSELRDMNTRCK